VEELTYKQVVKALRDKSPLDQYLASHGMQEELKILNTKTESAPKRERRRSSRLLRQRNPDRIVLQTTDRKLLVQRHT